jgi:hypothetical protein
VIGEGREDIFLNKKTVHVPIRREGDGSTIGKFGTFKKELREHRKKHKNGEDKLQSCELRMLGGVQCVCRQYNK